MYKLFPFERPSRLFVKIPLIIAICLFMVSTSIPARAQGFGKWKIEVELFKYVPPKVFLEGADIAFEIASQRNVDPQFTQNLKELLERLLPLRDRRLTPVLDEPETIIACDIAELYGSSRIETRCESVYKKTGEHTEYDEATQMDKTVEDYGYVNESYDVTIVEGYISVLYQCKDAKTGNVIDSDTLAFRHHQQYRHIYGAPNTLSAERSLIENIASEISNRFGSSVERSIALLPKGKLKGASQLLQKSMWNSALEKLSSMWEFKDHYLKEVSLPLRDAFPNLVSYNRFVELMPEAFAPLYFYLQTRKGKTSGIAFTDSLSPAVRH